MSHKKFNVPVLFIFSFTLLLFLSLLISLKFISIAQENGSPPVLEDFALSTHEINSDIANELVVYVRASDNSGIQSISGRLVPMAFDEETNWDTQMLSLEFSLALDCGAIGGLIDLEGLTGCGDEYDGVYSATVEFPLGSTAGDWKVENIDITANVGGLSVLFNVLETIYGVGSATVENVGLIQDTEGPVIVAYSFDKLDNEIDTTLEGQTLVLTMRVTDDISGVRDSFDLQFISPYEGHQATFALSLKEVGTCDVMYVSEIGNCGDKNDGIYESTVTTIPRWSAKGVWTLDSMPSDILGNLGTLPVEPVFFTNIAEIEDIAPPTIKSLVVDKLSFDTSQSDVTITITMELEDDVSGIDIESRIGIRPVFDWGVGISSADFVLLSGDTNDGTFKAEIVIPKDSKPGFWSFTEWMIMDNAGNGSSVDMSDYIEEIYLANTALSNEVTIANVWWLEGKPLTSVSYNGQQKVNSIWPSITIIFDEGTVVTKSGGGNFGIHRMVSESYLTGEYDSLGLLLNDVNSKLNTDLEKCDISEGCVAEELNDNNLVGSPINIGKVGLPGLGLSFSKPVTVILAVDAQYLGQTLNIQTFDGTSWINQGTCVVRTFNPLDPAQGGNNEEWHIFVSYPGCSFTTDHASFFTANVLGAETTRLPGVPETGLGGTASLFERYIGWSR